MKIVLDNIIYFLQRSGGMSVYWSEIISRLESRKDLDIHYTEPKGSHKNMYYEALRKKISAKLHTETTSAKLLSFLTYGGWPNERYIFHSSYYRTSRSPAALNVVTIHDFIPEMYFKGVRQYFHAYRKRRAITRAQGIVCISNNTYNDLLKYYPDVASKPIRIIYNGISEDYYPLKAPFSINIKTKGKYILFVGKRFAYKNFQFAIELLKSLTIYNLLIVGDALKPEEARNLASLGGRFELCENPTNQELNALYNGAHCLLYPSSYEGFGIPIIEAMSAGCPVVGLRSGAVEEVSGDAALLASSLNVEEFSASIQSLENPVIRKESSDRGISHAKKYSWDNAVSQLVLFYKSLGENGRPFDFTSK